MNEQSHKYRIFGIYLVLAAITFIVYARTLTCDFVNFDDDIYVTDNQYVKAGLTSQSVLWAFKSPHIAFWHPLTMLSHMLDCQLFGLKPAGHHLVNLLFHIANTLLLFAVLNSMTAAIWQSAFVAAAFALHPLHVESVAWISERKDVLSTLFWLLTMAAYLRYAGRSSFTWYMVTLLLFAMGLMAKPMLVTLPFVLLLLDYWPLHRLVRVTSHESRATILEKLPFIVLSVAFGIITVFAQQSKHILRLDVPLTVRLTDAVVAFLTYIEKMFWPARLAVFYPRHAGKPHLLYAALVAALLLAISIVIILLARKRKYLFVGWFWYLGTLVPVSGLIKVGSGTFAMADRYTYIPLIGLFLIIAWAIGDIAAKWQHKKLVLGLSALAALSALSICTNIQLRHWRNSIALFEHALNVTTANSTAHYNLACALGSQGRFDEAISHYRQSLLIKPDDAGAHYSLGFALQSKGSLDEAITHYRRALQLDPEYANAHYSLGSALQLQGKLDEAVTHYRRALRLKPDDLDALCNLGEILASQNKFDEAITSFRQALRIKPDHPRAAYNLALTLQLQGNLDQAMTSYHQTLRITPDSVEAAANLAWLLATHPDPKMRDPNQAVTLAEHAAELTQHRNAMVLNALAAAYASAGRFDKAVTTAQTALDLAAADRNDQLADQILRQLQSYKQGKP
jgi:tetratricopeptide (TPR) repeat protein